MPPVLFAGKIPNFANLICISANGIDYITGKISCQAVPQIFFIGKISFLAIRQSFNANKTPLRNSRKTLRDGKISLRNNT